MDDAVVSVIQCRFPVNRLLGLYYWPWAVHRLQFPYSCYQSTCWMVQRLTSRRLASSRWLTP